MGILWYRQCRYLQKEERELEKIREADQRRATKELMMAQRTEEEQRLKRNVEERQRAKQEEARARDKIRLKLGPLLPLSPLMPLKTACEATLSMAVT